jgi:hypothetical protein
MRLEAGHDHRIYRPPNFNFQLDILFRLVVTLPALKMFHSIHSTPVLMTEEGSTLESMIELLQSCTLRKVTFTSVVFTNNPSKCSSQGIEKVRITDLHFIRCSLPRGGDAVIAGLLETNTTDECLCYFLTPTKPFYETWQRLFYHSTLKRTVY